VGDQDFNADVYTLKTVTFILVSVMNVKVKNTHMVTPHQLIQECKSMYVSVQCSMIKPFNHSVTHHFSESYIISFVPHMPKALNWQIVYNLKTKML